MTILTGWLDGEAVLDDVICKGDETSLFHCQGNLTDHNCHDGEGAGVDCICMHNSCHAYIISTNLSFR